MNVKWKDSIHDFLKLSMRSFPFIMNNDSAEIDNLSKATGGKAIMSQRIAIQRAGYVSEEEIDSEIKRIQDEESMSANVDLFQPTF